MPLSPRARSAVIANAVGLIDAGSVLEIRTDSGRLLAATPFADPPFAPEADGTCLARFGDGKVTATGRAAGFRVLDGTGDEVMAGTVTATGGGGDIELDRTDLEVGGSVVLGPIHLAAAQGA